MSSTSANPGKDGPAPRAGARSTARLAAIQALYQIQLLGGPTETVLREFVDHRFRSGDDDSAYSAPDVDLFCDIVRGVPVRSSDLEPLVGGALATGWRLDRLDRVMQALLLSGAYELVARPDVPTAVIINEYVDLAHAFFDDEQKGFAHAVLDRIARQVRHDPNRPTAAPSD